MEEIQIGTYVRDKKGNITEIISMINLDKGVYLYLGKDGFQYSDNCIVKHSKNIIDLIEVGDIIEAVTEEDFEGEYTTKLEVAAVGITDGQGNKLNEIGICGEHGIEFVDLKDIRTILTHEQYENNCYRIGE